MHKKGRKRTVANILDEYDNPSSSTSNQPPSTKEIEYTTRKSKAKVQCFCSKCNGKQVNSRTKDTHDRKGQTSLKPLHSEQLHSEQLTPLPNIILPDETPMSQLLVEPLDSAIIEDEENLVQPIIDNDEELEELEKSIFTFLLCKRKN